MVKAPPTVSPLTAAMTGLSNCHIFRVSFFWAMSVKSIWSLNSSLILTMAARLK